MEDNLVWMGRPEEVSKRRAREIWGKWNRLRENRVYEILYCLGSVFMLCLDFSGKLIRGDISTVHVVISEEPLVTNVSSPQVIHSQVFLFFFFK